MSKQSLEQIVDNIDEIYSECAAHNWLTARRLRDNVVNDVRQTIAAQAAEIERLRWYAEFVIEKDLGAEFDEWLAALEGSD